MSNAGTPDWELNGFDRQPAEYEAQGTEYLYRCFTYLKESFEDRNWNKQGSLLFGNCFWVFRCDNDMGPIRNVMANRSLFEVEFLEENLNAALWENTYMYVGQFLLKPHITYRIGPVGQNTRGVHRDIAIIGTQKQRSIVESDVTPFSSQNFMGSGGALLQVTLDVPRPLAVRDCVHHVATFPVAGRDRMTRARSVYFN